jgi:small subunit ribosomal protein S1
MVNNRTYRSRETIPPLDEAWWSALLADEERYVSNYQATRGEERLEDPDYEPPHELLDENPSGVDWERVEELYLLDETISLTVSGYNRGGLLVEGEFIHGFVPISHLLNVSCETPEENRDEALSRYQGQTIYLKVIECESARGRIVLSERAALASDGRRNQLLSELLPGDCVHGVVTNVTDFGIFVDLGGVEGLVHVSEISWGRVRHPEDAVEVGQEVTAYVITVDRERARIALSLKRLCDNPWEYVEERYHPGQVVEAVITSIVPFGAFARLEEGLDGLIHVTEMAHMSDGTNSYQMIEEGQKIKVRILHIDASRQRLGLSLNIGK